MVDVILIFKKEHPENYRPASPSDPGKVMGKIFSEAISEYVGDKRVIEICQCVFVKEKYLIKLLVFFVAVTDAAYQGRAGQCKLYSSSLSIPLAQSHIVFLSANWWKISQ